MKTLNKVIFTIFIISVLYVARDDLAIVYNRGANYIGSYVFGVKEKQSEMPEAIIYPNANTVSNIDLKSSNTTEPLKVLNSFIGSSKKSANLSKAAIIQLTNQNRAENGNLPSLKENSQLNLSAEKKLQDMFNKQYFEHVSPDGIGVSDLGNQVGYDYINIGENLALGNFTDDKSLMDAWMASPGHRANILSTHYSEIGVAVGKGLYEGKTVWISVQHFGLPKDICPSVDEVLRGLITIDESNIKSLKDNLDIRKNRIESGAIYDGMTTDEQITKYNDLISVYNQTVNYLKEKINKYNNQVREFNQCLESNT